MNLKSSERFEAVRMIIAKRQQQLLWFVAETRHAHRHAKHECIDLFLKEKIQRQLLIKKNAWIFIFFITNIYFF